jgi:hypothetical protein
MMEIKTSWEIKDWVEDSIPEEKKEYVDWNEVHYDKWGKEYYETHSRDCKKWVSVDSLIEELKDIVNYAKQKQDKHKNGYPTFKLHIEDLIEELKR